MPKPNQKISQREREICARLKEFREAIKWSQPDFAEYVGLTKNQLASIEYGRTPLRYDTAWKIRTLFGLSVDWLWGGDMGPSDLSEDHKLPSSDATGLPETALLTEVFAKVHGAEVNEIHYPRQPKSISKKSKDFEDEVRHRALVESWLHQLSRDWISRVPTGYTADFRDKIIQLAHKYLKAAPKVSEGEAGEMFDALVWDEMRRDIAKRTSVQALGNKSELDSVTDSGKHSDVKRTMASLLARLNKATEAHGMKSKLAKYMEVPLPNVSQWLSGEREPSGETTLRLLHWVEQQERKK